MEGASSLPDRFRLVRMLGKGGFADVFLVEEPAAHPARRALKILLPNAPDAILAAFRNEFRVLAGFTHPGLVSAYEWGTLDDGRAFYTAEWVEGAAFGRGPPLLVRDVCLVAAAICRTLAYLHARGTVHNDVTPINILVSGAAGTSGSLGSGVPRRVCLLDFGLAGIDRASTGTVAGTPGFIAPERLAGRSWDGRADLYSLGATLYRVLGGRRVTDSHVPAKALQDLRAGARPLSALRPDLPVDLMKLVDRLLAFDARERPRGPYEVIARLGDAIGEALPLETPETACCYALSSLFTGREDETERLDAALRRVAVGEGPRVLIVAGVPGSGKTRLAREIGRRAEMDGWRRLETTCAERPAAAGEPLAKIGARLGLGDEATAGGAEAAAAATAFLAIAAAQPRRPMMLVFDDAHHASAVVWDAVFGLAERAAERRRKILALLVVDPTGLPPEIRRRLEAATAAGEATRVDVGPLPAARASQVMASLFGDTGPSDEAFQENIARRSRGNPLLLEELVREKIESGIIRPGTDGWTAGWAVGYRASDAGPSGRLEGLLRRRCLELSPDATRTLAAVAALGGVGTFEAVAATAEPGTDVRLGMAGLDERDLVTVEAATGENRSARVKLQHTALLPIALAALDRDARVALHQRAAEWLSAHGADDARLSHAWREAGDGDAAFGHAVHAARDAQWAGNARTAARRFADAIALARDSPSGPAMLCELHARHGELLTRLGRPVEAMAALTHAFDLGPTDAPTRERARMSLLAAQAALSLGWGVADTWIKRVVALAAQAPNDTVMATWAAQAEALRAGERGQISLARQKGRDALVIVGRAVADADTAAIRVTTRLWMVEAEMCFHLTGARILAEEAVEAAKLTRHQELAVSAAAKLGAAEAALGNLDAAIQGLGPAIEAAERLGQGQDLPELIINLARAQHLRGRWDRARALADRAAALGGSDDARAGCAVEAALRSWREGDFPAAGVAAARALDARARFGNRPLMMAVATAAAAECRDSAEAERWAAAAVSEGSLAQTPWHSLMERIARAYATAASSAGDGAALLRDAAEAAGAFGYKSELACLLRDAALWLGRAGDAEGAGACAADARRLLVDMECTPGLDRLNEMMNAPPVERRAAAAALAPGSETAWLRSLVLANTRDDLAARVHEASQRAFALETHLLFTPESGTLPPEIVAAARAALASGVAGRMGEWLLQPVGGGGADAGCLASKLGDRVEPPELAFMVEAIAAALALIAERAPSRDLSVLVAPLDAPPAAAAPEAPSRIVELTLGPLELRHDFPQVVGRSAPMTRALVLLDRLSSEQVPVLLTGETGTGKEVFARALHDAGPRARGPFLALNCAAVPASIFESELFGHRRGAFTGAVRDHDGYAQQASGGTLFLDEVGELASDLQPKLLRMLEEHRIRPVGGDRDTAIDVRLVAATNRDLAMEVTAGRFRPDLFYRLNVVEIRLPPLRERMMDLPELCRHLLARHDRAQQEVTPGAMGYLARYLWPGNIRELENELLRAAVLAGDEPITERHLSPKLTSARTSGTPGKGTMAERVAAFEREIVQEALREAGGNRPRAARALGITRQGVGVVMRRLGLAPPKKTPA